MKNKLKFTVFDMAVVGVMAAICFVVTYFIKIEIPTPAGPVMIKLANAFCLLAGVLFGGLRGGLAAGIGSMFFDLLDPKYITDAPITLVRFFLVAFICGIICFSKNRSGMSTMRNIIGCSAGALFNVAFYFVQSLIKQLILGQPFSVAFINIIPKMTTSLINAGIAIVVACMLAPIMYSSLKKAGLYKKLGNMHNGGQSQVLTV